MPRNARLVEFKDEPKAHHELGGRQEVLFASYHEAPGGEVLSCGCCLGHLVMTDPPGAGDNSGLPGAAVAQCHASSLVESFRGHGLVGMVLYNDTRGAM